MYIHTYIYIYIYMYLFPKLLIQPVESRPLEPSPPAPTGCLLFSRSYLHCHSLILLLRTTLLWSSLYPNLPYPILPYPTQRNTSLSCLTYPTLSYPILPYPILPYYNTTLPRAGEDQHQPHPGPEAERPGPPFILNLIMILSCISICIASCIVSLTIGISSMCIVYV